MRGSYYGAQRYAQQQQQQQQRRWRGDDGPDDLPDYIARTTKYGNSNHREYEQRQQQAHGYQGEPDRGGPRGGYRGNQAPYPQADNDNVDDQDFPGARRPQPRRQGFMQQPQRQVPGRDPKEDPRYRGEQDLRGGRDYPHNALDSPARVDQSDRRQRPREEEDFDRKRHRDPQDARDVPPRQDSMFIGGGKIERVALGAKLEIPKPVINEARKNDDEEELVWRGSRVDNGTGKKSGGLGDELLQMLGEDGGGVDDEENDRRKRQRRRQPPRNEYDRASDFDDYDGDIKIKPSETIRMRLKQGVGRRDEREIEWRDTIYAMDPREMLEIDKSVRLANYAPAENVIDRASYAINQIVNEQRTTLRRIGWLLYDAGIQSIWLRPGKREAGYRIMFGKEETFQKAMFAKTTEEALNKLQDNVVVTPNGGVLRAARGDMDAEEAYGRYATRRNREQQLASQMMAMNQFEQHLESQMIDNNNQ